jgi:ferritin-like metal-binding protein YciE
MIIFSTNLDELRNFYIDQLEQMHSAEIQMTESLPKIIRWAHEPALREALQTHLHQTQGHISRLEQILSHTKGSVSSKKCKAAAALIAEGEDVIQDATDDSVRDVAIIGAAQKVEHYEIAAYGTLRTLAQVLGQHSQVELLERTLREERQADSLLTEIAQTANPKADRVAPL